MGLSAVATPVGVPVDGLGVTPASVGAGVVVELEGAGVTADGLGVTPDSVGAGVVVELEGAGVPVDGLGVTPPSVGAGVVVELVGAGVCKLPLNSALGNWNLVAARATTQ